MENSNVNADGCTSEDEVESARAASDGQGEVAERTIDLKDLVDIADTAGRQLKRGREVRTEFFNENGDKIKHISLQTGCRNSFLCGYKSGFKVGYENGQASLSGELPSDAEIADMVSIPRETIKIRLCDAGEGKIMLKIRVYRGLEAESPDEDDSDEAEDVGEGECADKPKCTNKAECSDEGMFRTDSAWDEEEWRAKMLNGVDEAESNDAARWADEEEVYCPEAEDNNGIRETIRIRSSVMDEDLSVEFNSAQVVQWLSGESGIFLTTDINKLKGVLKLHRAGCDSAAKPNAASMKQFMIKNALQAVERVNALRERHPHCGSKPLTQSYCLCLTAADAANNFALLEEANGFTQELANSLCENTLTYGIDGDETLRMGLAACRLQVISSASLPEESVNFWYKKGESYQFDDPKKAAKNSEYWNFIQLLDGASQYMGWAAAMAATGAVYAVAVFDHIGAADAKSVRSMLPSVREEEEEEEVEGKEGDEEAGDNDEAEDEEAGDEAPASEGGSEPSSPSVAAAAKFDFAAPPVIPMQQILRRLPGVGRLFSADAADPGTEQETAALTRCNVLTQKAYDSIVHMRRQHRRTEPIALSQSLCIRAALAANKMANSEDCHGLRTQPLGCSVVFPDVEDRLGCVSCRIEECKDAASESVDFWSRGSKSFPYNKLQDLNDEEFWRSLESQHWHLLQLLDIGSKYVGWGAAMTESGAVYAIALFDRVGATERNVKSLKRSIGAIGVKVF